MQWLRAWLPAQSAIEARPRQAVERRRAGDQALAIGMPRRQHLQPMAQADAAPPAGCATRPQRIGLFQVAVERRLRDPHQPADLGDAVLLVVVERDGMPALFGIEQLRPAAFAAACPRRGEPGLGPLADQRALELGQRRKQVEGELAVDRRGVDPLGQGAEFDTAILQRTDQHDQVGHRPAEPVEPPDHQMIPGAPHFEREPQAGPRCLGAAHAILVDARAARPGQGVALQVEVLVLGRDARIADHNSGHRGRKLVKGSGSQTLKPYPGLLPIRNRKMRPADRCRHVGKEPLVFLPATPPSHIACAGADDLKPVSPSLRPGSRSVSPTAPIVSRSVSRNSR